MKLFILLTLFSFNAFALCNSVISRTNSSPNTVLTSTKYNLDLNTVFTRANELPGDCVTDATIGQAKLIESEFAPLLEGIKEGCFATRTDANTISIDKCIISVSGNLIKKTTATTVTWACSGCSSEVISTTYYVYATDASTLTLKISTTAPDAFGYNGAERALARFYNNASSDIDTYSVDQWLISRFEPQKTGLVAFTPTGSWVSNATYTGTIRRFGRFAELQYQVATTGAPTATALTLNLPTGLLIDSAGLISGANISPLTSQGLAIDTGTATFVASAYWSGSGNVLSVNALNAGGSFLTVDSAVTQAVPMTWANGDFLRLNVRVPIVGWVE